MPITFQPKKEEELNRFESLPPGEYPFSVMESREVASKSEKNNGRIMCNVKLNVHGPKFDRHVYDLFADWLSEWKLKHFCETTGMAADYAAGKVDSSNQAWQGKTGWVKLGIRKDGSKYDGQNEVEDYIVKAAAAAPVATPPTETDDVPFK